MLIRLQQQMTFARALVPEQGPALAAGGPAVAVKRLLVRTMADASCLQRHAGAQRQPSAPRRDQSMISGVLDRRPRRLGFNRQPSSATQRVQPDDTDAQQLELLA